jgi:PAS domain S-box-containing protein
MGGPRRGKGWPEGEFLRVPMSSAHEEDAEIRNSVSATELRESELKYRTLVETLPHAVIIIQDSRIAFANTTAAEILGSVGGEDLVGRDPLEFVAASEIERLRDYLHRRLSGQSDVPEQYETVITTPNGRKLDAEIRVKTFSFKGRIASQLVVTDITGRRQSEIETRLLMESIEQMEEGIAFFGLDERLLFSNRSFASLHGYTTEELIGKHHSTFLQTEELLGLVAANEETQRVGKSSAECSHVRKEGTSFPVFCASTLVRNDLGSPIGMIVAVRDISDTRVSERVMSCAQEKFSRRFSGLEKQLHETSAELSHSQSELTDYARRLEQSNEALKLVIGEIENQKRERERAVYRNLNSTVLTVIDQLKSERLPDSSRLLLDALEFNLKSLFSPPTASLPQANVLLTPQQTRVCDLIRSGLTSKQIAEVMGISPATVVVHRTNIRKRLGLLESGDNLATYLRSVR